MALLVKWSDEKERLVMSRNEVIAAWKEAERRREAGVDNNQLCCPNCRDLLYKNIDGDYYCDNVFCKMPGEIAIGGKF
jgi:hypothetical protein